MSHIPLQNRVDPWGQLHAVSARGTLMGNRGTLHDANKKVVRAWSRKQWIFCSLEFKGIRRVPFSPGAYSELFFLDEATAFAAGHRPCASCLRERHLLFKKDWFAGNALASNVQQGVVALDGKLHSERMASRTARCLELSRLADLPTGTFVVHQQQPRLVWGPMLLLWTFEGYRLARAAELDSGVEVITPPSIIAAFRGGFVPRVHASANAC